MLAQAFIDAANVWRVEKQKNLIFTEIPVDGEHYNGLAQYIKIDLTKSPIILIDGSKRVKYVLS